VCVAVGWSSLATFTRTFRRLVGVTPARYRATGAAPAASAVPTCFEKAWLRPSNFGTMPSARSA
jgi:AraC-like DNA-binding protein